MVVTARLEEGPGAERDGWVDRQMGGWTDGQIDGRMDGHRRLCCRHCSEKSGHELLPRCRRGLSACSMRAAGLLFSSPGVPSGECM